MLFSFIQSFITLLEFTAYLSIFFCFLTLCRFCPSEQIAVMDYLLSNPEQSWWVLDGYDEFHNRLTKKELKMKLLDSEKPLPIADLISGLLNRQLLPGCTVVITCHAPCRDLESVSDKMGHLQGWDCHDIKEYVHNYFEVRGEKMLFYFSISIMIFSILQSSFSAVLLYSG